MKNLNKSIIVVCFFLNSFLIQGQKEEQIYILANTSEIVKLDGNYCKKTIDENNIIFSIGLETLGEINKFIFNKKNSSIRCIGLSEYKKLKISSIEELNKVLWSKKSIKNPNAVFKKIFIVEKNNDKVKLYKVYWEKKVYKE